MKDNIGIIDIGIGNIKSVQNIIYSCGYSSDIITKSEEVPNFKKIILPGVGSFDPFMNKLIELKFDKIIKDLVFKNKIIILGICLGMHVLFKNSEEGKINGLSILDGNIQKLNSKNKLVKIPHNGWNKIKIKKNNKLFNIDDDLRFYFNHSYYLNSTNENNIVATTMYGQNIISSVENNNIFGVQFHPEKSHNYGKIFFKRFISM